MDRRWFLAALASSSTLVPSNAIAQEDAFARALAALANDTVAIDAANGTRERFQRVAGDPAGATQSTSWRRASTNAIGDRARMLIITCEVSGRAAYERRYQRPVRPGGHSGVTIGIGFDLGYVSPDYLRAQWDALLSDETINKLSNVCGLRGQHAQDAVAGIQDVTVSWSQAGSQFDRFLPYAIGKTEDTFHNSASLPPDCLGALVSLVYNRGPSLSSTSPRRAEMREIARLTRDGAFALIPAQIRAMKRIWQDDPNLRGLVQRRELEALLFEQALAAP